MPAARVAWRELALMFPCAHLTADSSVLYLEAPEPGDPAVPDKGLSALSPGRGRRTASEKGLHLIYAVRHLLARNHLPSGAHWRTFPAL